MKKQNLFEGLSKSILDKRKKTPQPLFVTPMLATLTKNYFSSKDWIYEPKFDGERCLVIKKNNKVYLMSRSRHTMNIEYPELVQACMDQNADNFIIDGEIIACDKKGISDFQLLQSRINLQDMSSIKQREKKIHIKYCIFDVMYAGGYDVRNLPLLARKSILKKLLDYHDMLIYVNHRSPNGIAYFKKACHLHWEGLIAKESDGTYVGLRSPTWLKFKCAHDQELVIIGYTDPHGSRTDFGALLVGYYSGKKLLYAGKVGTGFSENVLKMLGKKLRVREIKTCPASNYTESTKGIHWVKPELVAEFKFEEWTKDNKLRVPRYQGLRDDKAAKDVIKEVPV